VLTERMVLRLIWTKPYRAPAYFFKPEFFLEHPLER
jgi:hypothetical protein